jgi:lysophospholipase L1-like esterase
MKTILCYGDSNTWGYSPHTGERFPPDVRWTGVLRQTLGTDYRVIEEGLNGRTTVWDDPIEGAHKNGKAYLVPCLESHAPFDLITIMLGTNDLKQRFNILPSDIAAGAGVLVEVALRSAAGVGGKAPKVLLMCPPPTAATEGTPFAEMFAGAQEKSQKLAARYRVVAEMLGCAFLDAGEIVVSSPVDAIHFEPDAHRKLGEAVAARVQQMLG